MLAWGVLAVQPLTATAQQLNPGVSDVGGSPAADLVVVSTGLASVPLRHGGVIANSERVYLSGLLLANGADYTIDYDSGIIYLIGPGHAGQTISVNYRYVPGKTSGSANFGNGVNTFQFNLMPGAVNMRLGFGLAERAANGSVLRSNIFGLNTDYKLGMFGGGGS